MRCPDCNKFVSMDNGDPEVDNIEASFNGDGFHVEASFGHSRNCADCGTELKRLDGTTDADVPLDSFEGWKALSDDRKESIKKRLSDGSLEADVEESGADADESGGGRYAKNIIRVIIHYTITIEDDDGKVKLIYSGELENEAAASEYEECC